MGRPVHYSTDIPERCKDLIDLLVGHVETDPKSMGKWGGPLRTTFLLSMATPMIVLPIERIFMPVVRGHPRVADDTTLDPEINARVADVLGPNCAFERAPFFELGKWHFVPDCPAFNVAGHWPLEVLKALGSSEAERSARTVDAAEILMVLRNALAHGGITYLDRNGGQSEFATSMISFASWKRTANPRALRLLRVSVDAFQKFLGNWADWLTHTGVTDALSYRGPGYFEEAAA